MCVCVECVGVVWLSVMVMMMMVGCGFKVVNCWGVSFVCCVCVGEVCVVCVWFVM